MKRFCTFIFSLLIFLLIPSFSSAEELSLDGLEDYKFGYFKSSVEVESSANESKLLDHNVSGNVPLGISPSSTSWKRVTWYQDAYSRANIHLYRFTYQVYWEWNGSQITSVTRSSTPSVYAPGWKYEKLSTNTGYYYNNNQNYYTLRQGHFRFGTGPWDIQHMYPWIEFDFKRGGNYSYARGF